MRCKPFTVFWFYVHQLNQLFLSLAFPFLIKLCNLNKLYLKQKQKELELDYVLNYCLSDFEEFFFIDFSKSDLIFFLYIF